MQLSQHVSVMDTDHRLYYKDLRAILRLYGLIDPDISHEDIPFIDADFLLLLCCVRKNDPRQLVAAYKNAVTWVDDPNKTIAIVFQPGMGKQRQLVIDFTYIKNKDAVQGMIIWPESIFYCNARYLPTIAPINEM